MPSHPLLLFSLFLLGIAGQLLPFVPEGSHRRINRFIILLPLPAITLAKIPHLQITPEVMFPIAAAWIIFFASILFALLMGKWLHLSRATVGCLILSCGLGNTSFIGYPLLTWFYGPQSIQYAIFVDQPGSFFLMSTFGVLIAVLFSSGKLDAVSSGKKLFSFPPFVVFLISLFIPAEWINGKLLDGLNFTGSFMVPLALLSLGLQFRPKPDQIRWKPFAAGLIYKLLLAPAIVYALYYGLLHKSGEIYAVSVIECAMPPMITSSIIAADHGLDEELAGLLPTMGILFSIPTLYFWHRVLG